eukprot:4993894-Prymnesium_polylepis.1
MAAAPSTIGSRKRFDSEERSGSRLNGGVSRRRVGARSSNGQPAAASGSARVSPCYVVLGD